MTKGAFVTTFYEVLKSLRLLNFRCYEQLAIDLPAEGALFVGDNAQGKTSILEAICILMRLQSPRSSKPKDFINFEAKSCGIAGEYGAHEYRFDYGQLEAQKRALQAALTLDGEVIKRNAHYLENSGLVVWIGNQDLDLIRASGEVRRRYLDFLATQLNPTYRLALKRYTRALRARNVLLKNHSNSKEELDIYTELLVQEGELIIEYRRELVELINPFVAASLAQISESNEVLSLTYEPSVSEALGEAFAKNLERDKRMGITSVGPHRDDLGIQLNDKKVKTFGSEGQQRSVAISLKLGQGELLRSQSQKKTLYLIDDVFGELDHRRRNAMLSALPEDAQKFITTTQLDWMSNDRFSQLPVHQVAGGQISI